MGLYSSSVLESVEKMAESNELLEAFIVDDLIHRSTDDIKSFCEGEECKILVEKAVLKKPTMMRLDKAADAKRREKLAAYMIARAAGDPAWKNLVKYTKLRKQCISKIMDKYGAKAKKVALASQKNYIKTAAKISSTAKSDEKSDK